MLLLKLKVLLLILILISFFPCFSQSTLDYRNKTIISCSIGAQANFSAKRMNIRFQEKGVQWGGSDDVIRDIATSAAQTTAGSFVNFDSSQSSSVLIGWMSALFPPTSVSYIIAVVKPMILNMLASNNIGSRSYLFYAPVHGWHNIQCDLKGGWDLPRNRVGVYSSTSQVISYDHELSADQTVTFTQELDPGPYWVVVGLGGGSSVVFHTAGRMAYAELNDTNLRNWSIPVVTNFNTYNALLTLPTIGSKATLSVPYTQPGPNTDILDGNPVTFTNQSSLPVYFITPPPAPLATWKDPNFEGCRRWVVSIDGIEYSTSIYSNNAGTFYVERTADVTDCE